MRSRSSEAGFTAVEILISIIIAALLVGGAYQVYGIVLGTTAEARERSVASNYAYEALQTGLAVLPNTPCSATSELTVPNAWATIPTNIKVTSRTYRVTCPYGTLNNVSSVRVTVRYGSPEKEVVHATYTKES